MADEDETADKAMALSPVEAMALDLCPDGLGNTYI